ncbi:MAG: glycosyltransferase [Gammaproteobacteria bacterium]|nr:glycosyltransferase [Gammaproteobacteria bacterium]
MNEQKTIAFFPEGAFGPALNSVGIAQACTEMGHRCVFLTDPGFAGVFSDYGFEERTVRLSEEMPPGEMAKYWSNFIDGHIPNFNLTPYQQIDNYVKECWEAIVDTAIWAEKDLPSVLSDLDPDLICIDNVILFPAAKQFGVPWIRIISCSENEIEDPMIPPHLSGCGENDQECFEAYRNHFNDVVTPVHEDFNNFLKACGEEPYAIGQFFEASPYMNLLLYPEPLQYKRKHPLNPDKFQYLEGCVRSEEHYEVPEFKKNNDAPLIYLSFGSLGSGDTDLLKRMIGVLGGLDYRVLVNVGDYGDDYDSIPDNVHIASWYPQPSVIEQCDAVIHHGGNNSFTECLYFGKPALIMPYVWDGHDNSTRVEETGHGLKMHRANWTDEQFSGAIHTLLNDKAMHAKLEATSAHMKRANGRQKAAQIIDQLLRTN